VDLIGKRVKHAVFGEGEIIAQDEQYISVRFTAVSDTKKFQYPACFKTFLKLLDAVAAAQTEKAVKQHEEKQQKEKQKEREEAEIRRFAKGTKGGSINSNRTVEVRPMETVDAFCDLFVGQLTSEVVYLRTTGGKRQRVNDGVLIEAKRERYVYSFEADAELNYPEGTQITIWRGMDSFPATIVGCEDFTIIIVTSTNMGVNVPTIEFSAEPWRLLNALIDRLNEMREAPSFIVRLLVSGGYKAIDYTNKRITTGQQNAIAMAQSQPITFVWGPPGTGKTQTLAKIALAHIQSGHRVLMLSYSNVSVDGAVMRVHQLAERKTPGVVVRYGYARRKDLLQHDYLTTYNLAIHNHPELQRESRALIAKRKTLKRSDPEYLRIGRRLSEIKNALAEEEKDAVRTAQFVATTVSKAVVDSVVRNSDFDVVIFDEASMAYIPQIIFSASLAAKHFVCMGDFRQLPPIVQSSNESKLNADIFQYCGITEAVDRDRNHKWLCMLDTQYRMHPKIAEFASHAMYGGLLRSAEGMLEKRNAITAVEPLGNHALGFADLSGMMSVCAKTGDNSRFNVLSAWISFAMALEAAKKNEVGIITPYHAQSRLLHAMARDAAEQNTSLNPISCATVHQFQGSEKDVIIYDAVDCYRMPFPGMLLTSMANNYANRLYNVAVTRAKGKFISVANVSYMDHKNLSNKLMFERMIEVHRRKDSCATGYGLIKRRSHVADTSMEFLNAEAGKKGFLVDISNAKTEIRIDIPGGIANDIFARSLSEELRKAKARGVKVFVRAEEKQRMPTCLLQYVIENPFVFNPIAIIDKKINWFGMPCSEANFVSEGVEINTLYRPIIRFEGKYTAASLYGFAEMNKTIDQSKTASRDEKGKLITSTFADYVLAHETCSECGEPMKVQKSRNGRFFLSCTDYPTCTNTDLITTDLVDEYLYRKGGTGQKCVRCNCSMDARVGKYGIFVQCCGIPRHNYRIDEI